MGLKGIYVSKLNGYLLYGLWNNAWRGGLAARRNVNLRRESESPSIDTGPAPAEWWKKPGLGLMFQIEARPGWSWQRNFDRFNASLTGPDGTLQGNGPFPQMQEWVDFSGRIGADYHVFEAKWHDGICYWDTPSTRWKTPVDYCRTFADASRRAGIPYGFYYSAVFDHNPELDTIQPLRRSTSSFLGMRGGKRAAVKKSLGFTQFIRILLGMMERQLRKQGMRIDRPRPYFEQFDLNDFTYDPERYWQYVRGHLDELCGRYGAEIMWIDWFGADREALSDEIMDLMEQRYPHVVLTFNASIIRNVRRAHYLSWEAHGIPGTWSSVRTFRNLRCPWELVTPAAANWDRPQAKLNPIENAITAALIMASGGKVNFGIAAEMDGTLRPEVVQQMEQLGAWYRPRRRLFVEAVPMWTAGGGGSGVTVEGASRRVVVTTTGSDRLIHLFDLHARPDGPGREVAVQLTGPPWLQTGHVEVEPAGRRLHVTRDASGCRIVVPADCADEVDTILRVRPLT